MMAKEPLKQVGGSLKWIHQLAVGAWKKGGTSGVFTKEQRGKEHTSNNKKMSVTQGREFVL